MVQNTSLLSRYFCKTIKLQDLVSQHLLLQPLPTLQELLNTVVIATNHGVNFLPENYSRDSLFNIEDILHRCIESMCQHNRSNVLSRGYNFIREGYKRACIRGSSCIQMKAPNTVVTYLKTNTWSRLHKLLGDDVVLHLFMNTSMFLSVGCNCYVQLCGVPLMELKISELAPCFHKEKYGTVQKAATSKIRSKRKHVRFNNKKGDLPLKKRKVASRKEELNETAHSSRIKRKHIWCNEKEYDPLHKKRKSNKGDVSSDKSLNQSTTTSSKKQHKRSTRNCNPITSSKLKKNKLKIRTKNAKSKENKNPKHNRQNAKNKKMIKKNTTSNATSSNPIVCVQRSRIFYSMSFQEGFHRKFILNAIPNSNSGVYALLNTIFQFGQADTKYQRIPKQLIGLKELMKTVIDNFKRLKLRKILNFYCPVPAWTRTFPRKWIRKGVKGSNLQNKVYYRFAVRSFTPLQKVFLFVRHIIIKVFPPLVWGSQRNKNVLIKALNRLLALDRYERLSVGNVMSGIKVSHFAWLNYRGLKKQKPLQQSQKHASIVQAFIVWMFNRFIVPLLRGCFYVTESNCHKNKVFYYRKPIWRIIRGLGLQPLLGSLYRPIHEKIAKEKLMNNESEGIHQIRLLPGQKKLRPISNMTNCSKSTNMRTGKFSINDEMKTLHLALQYEIHVNSKLLGVSVSSSEQIYERWRAFVDQCKRTHSTALPQLFFISLDISRCFDTLPQDQLVKLIPNCLREETYQIRKFVKIKLGHHGCTRKKYVSMATEGTDCTHFVSFVQKGLRSGRIVAKNTVFVDKVYYVQETRDKLLMLLRKHITCSIGYIGDRFLIQETGVAQGSILATTLNNIHYGNIECKNLMPFFQSSSDSVFMRWVDDYFFVTACKMQALKFLEALHTKMPKYGCKINTKKTLLNFEVSAGRGNNGNKFACIKGDWFPWCGYMFNCKTLESGVNYVQYIGERIQDGITFENASHPGLSMARKLILAVCLKATPLLADCRINSMATVHKNVYQVFRFAALKFLTHTKVLRKGGQPIVPHLPFYCKLVKKLPLKYWKVLRNNVRKSIKAHNSLPKNGETTLEKRRTVSINKETSAKNGETAPKNRDNVAKKTCYRNRLFLSRRIVEILCYQAFVDTLRSRKSVYGKLVQFLIHQLNMLKWTARDVKFTEIREHSRFLEMVIV